MNVMAMHPPLSASDRVTGAPVIHLSAREGRSLIFLSQVAKPMSFLARAGVDITIAMVCQLGDFVRRAERAQWREQAQALNALAVPWKRLVSYPSRLRHLAPDRRILAGFLRLRFSPETRFIVHCRGTQATQLALDLRRGFPQMRIVSDCRGVDGPEQAEHRGLGTDLSGPEEAWMRSLETRQRAALAESDAILCVSEAMKDYLVGSLGLAPDGIGVIPTCYSGRRALRSDADVREIRTRYAYDRKIVLAHAASETPWQRIEDVARLCSMLAARSPNLHFLFLGQHTQRIRERLDRHGLAPQRATVVSVPHDDVAQHLAAADAGIMLRSHSLVSRVASPVKFAEYLSAGLPVIVTPALGDQSGLVEREGVGLVLPSIEIDQCAVDAILKFLSDAPKLSAAGRRSREVAGGRLSWDKYIDTFRRAYTLAEGAARHGFAG